MAPGSSASCGAAGTGSSCAVGACSRGAAGAVVHIGARTRGAVHARAGSARVPSGFGFMSSGGAHVMGAGMTMLFSSRVGGRCTCLVCRASSRVTVLIAILFIGLGGGGNGYADAYEKS